VPTLDYCESWDLQINEFGGWVCCQLQIMYADLASDGFALDPSSGSAPDAPGNLWRLLTPRYSVPTTISGYATDPIYAVSFSIVSVTELWILAFPIWLSYCYFKFVFVCLHLLSIQSVIVLLYYSLVY